MQKISLVQHPAKSSGPTLKVDVPFLEIRESFEKKNFLQLIACKTCRLFLDTTMVYDTCLIRALAHCKELAHYYPVMYDTYLIIS